LQIRCIKPPKRNKWTTIVELLELFPLLNEVVFIMRRISYVSYQDSWLWYDSLEKVEYGAEPLSKFMTVKGSALLVSYGEGIYEENFAQTRWKCQPGMPLLNAEDFSRTKEWRPLPRSGNIQKTER
jgi:hypothetical protein